MDNGYHAFDPTGNTVAIGATTTSQAVALTDTGVGSDPRDYRIYNAGAVLVFLAFGGSGLIVVAPVAGTPANGIPLPAGSVEIFRAASSDTFLGVLASSTTATVYVTSGVGV